MQIEINTRSETKHFTINMINASIEFTLKDTDCTQYIHSVMHFICWTEKKVGVLHHNSTIVKRFELLLTAMLYVDCVK